MKKILLLVISVLIISFLCSYYISGTTVGESSTVTEVTENSITVLNQNGNLTTVSIPSIVHELIQEKKEYFVVFEYNVYRKPHLISISPID